MTSVDKTYRNIIFEREGAIAVVTMDRPEKRNALSVEHMEELLDCFEAIERDRSISVVILRGAGPVFSSGHDLREMEGQTEEFYQHEFALCSRLMEKIVSVPQPVIAEVHGIATAAGCQLVATCDLAIAAARHGCITRRHFQVEDVVGWRPHQTGEQANASDGKEER